MTVFWMVPESSFGAGIIMTLNHIQITKAKPRDKAYKLADAYGLYLAVQTNGTKLWRMNYRYLGRQKTLYFGAWPEVEIARSKGADRRRARPRRREAERHTRAQGGRRQHIQNDR